jgi:hypothetical protein
MSESNNYNITNPLRREGTSQRQRQLPALDPGLIKIDDRTIQDFLVFARDFARQIYYYDRNNSIAGDWTEFFAYDISFIIASIEKINPQLEKDLFQKTLGAFPSTEGLKQLFQQILVLVQKIDNWYLKLSPETGFGDQISRLVRSNLDQFLSQLLASDKGAFKIFGAKGYPEPIEEEYGFSQIWQLGDFKNITPNVSLFKNTWESTEKDPYNPTDSEKLANAYKKLNTQFTQLYNIFLQVIRQAATNFKESLELNTHEPHIALFMGFLYLYQKVQDDLNKLPAKHLDFYYKDVLQIKLKSAVSDKVHLYFKLARQTNDEYLLRKGTLLLAGKDNTGKPLKYSLDNDVVLNKATIDSIRTIFIERKTNGTLKSILAAPVANSEDGLGAEIKDKEKPSWKTFGDNKMPLAKIGFAIASNELLLAEGTRDITLTIQCNNELTLTDLKNVFVTELTGAKGWFVPKNPSSLRLDKGVMEIKMTLYPEDPAVVPFDAKTFKEKLGTTLPVLRIWLNQTSLLDNTLAIDAFKDLKIIAVNLAVGAKNVRNLLAFNDTSILNPTKSFLPFGVNPSKGSNFYVGSREAFQKKLTKLKLNIEWENLPVNGSLDFHNYYKGYDNAPSNNDIFTVEAKLLKSEGDVDLDGTYKLFENNPLAEIADNKLDYAIKPNEIENYGTSSKYGFLKLNLQTDFRHQEYPNALSRQLIAASKLPYTVVSGATYYKRGANNTTDYNSTVKANASTPYTEVAEAVIPNPPYTPTIKSISLEYTSAVNLTTTEAGNIRFVHLHPFADTYEQFSSLNNTPLLPRLHKKTDLTEEADLEGSLMLGLKDLKPGQSLSLLFQVAENTANADVEIARVKWQYLANNTWMDFKDYEITLDTTRGLITSGIITFAIPGDINHNNTILSDQQLWIRAWVEKNAVAVCEMINIHTQAVSASFEDNNNSPDHLASPLLPGIITKFEKDNPAIEKINQDYASFRGIPGEKPMKYYTRVSERLRHKGRAITIYDYERLVLEQFPEIYKAKCINHTNSNDQLAPGHVLVAVIPDFKNMKAVDKKQPKVTLAKLDEIRRYLESANSMFVGTFIKNGETNSYLHVVNPLYKKIRVEFGVKFMPEITAIEFYKRELRQAIVRFLSPWAYGGEELNFGGKVFKSSIQGFVEKQSYVDYVTNFSLMELGSGTSLNFIEADTARTILIPDDDDRFVIYDAGDFVADNVITKDTLGYTTIQKDFIVK